MPQRIIRRRLPNNRSTGRKIFHPSEVVLLKSWMKSIDPDRYREFNSTRTSLKCSKPIDVSQDLLRPLKFLYSKIIDVSNSGISLIFSMYSSRHVQSRVKFQTIMMLGVPAFFGTGITLWIAKSAPDLSEHVNRCLTWNEPFPTQALSSLRDSLAS